MLLLVGDDDVDVIPTPEAVVGYRQQAVGIGGEVHPHHFGTLVDRQIDVAGILVAEAVVVLPPHQGRQENIQRRHRGAPGHLFFTDVQPFSVLVEHRVHHVGEGFVGVEESVAAREEIALQPTLQGMLAEHFHHPSVLGHFATIFVFGKVVSHPRLFTDFVNGLEAVGGGFIRSEHPEIFHIASHHVPQEMPQNAGIFHFHRRGGGHVDGKVTEFGHPQFLAHPTAVGHGIVAHPAQAFGGDGFDLGHQRAVFVEKFLGFVAFEPGFEHLQVFGVFVHSPHGHLVRSPKAFGFVPVYGFRSRPPFGGAQDKHRPPGTLGLPRTAGFSLDGTNLADALLHRRCHLLVHQLGIVPFHDVGGVAVAPEEVFEFRLGNSR